MVVPVAKGGTKNHLSLFLFYFLSGLLISCGSTRLSPQLVSDSETALVVDSLLTGDAAMQAFIQPYKATLNTSLDSIVGYAAHPLHKQEVESTLGNFVADLTQEAAQQISDFPVDMGLVTIGGLRMPLPAGPIRIRDLYEVMPFENMIVVLQLSGEQTQKLFEFAARTEIAAISNSKMVVRDGKPVSITINGQAFDPNRSYTVATSDYLAGGGDNMNFLRDAKRALFSDLLLRTAIINKVARLQQEEKQVEAKIEGRIELLEQ